MQSKKIFIADDIFVAFIDRQHPKHIHADAFLRYFAIKKYYLYTDIICINHTVTLINRSISSSLAKDFLKSIETGNINILYPEESDFKESMKLITNQSPSEVSLENAIIPVLCNKKNIQQICTFKYFHSFFRLQPFYLPI